ncbi:MAG: hypothetical protein EOP64_01185 [Sphingomonas sp.]|nr:MAG: hypothetical protein EOP64_01185 [Sphingomonas sp.]
MKANYWQGLFPFANQVLDGWERTSPVCAYAPNGFGLADMIGNVWEWTSDSYVTHSTQQARSCCGGRANSRGAALRGSASSPQDGAQIGRKVIKGGSHLCAPNYCQRYRPAARQAQLIDSSTSHIGFRCVRRSAGPAGNFRHRLAAVSQPPV